MKSSLSILNYAIYSDLYNHDDVDDDGNYIVAPTNRPPGSRSINSNALFWPWELTYPPTMQQMHYYERFRKIIPYIPNVYDI